MASAGLERLGYHVRLTELEKGRFIVRWQTASATNGGFELNQWYPFDEAVLEKLGLTETDSAAAVTDVAARLASLGPVLSPIAQLLTELDVKKLVLAPIRVRRVRWGALAVLHDSLEADDAKLLGLFAGQLGSIIEAAETMATLERRTSELELVHQLASAAAINDIDELTRHALRTICRTTSSDAAMLHLFDTTTRHYVLTGECVGYDGPLVEHFRSFAAPPQLPLDRGPMNISVATLTGADRQVRDAGFTFLAVAPLELHGTHVGLLSLARREDEPYVPPELRSAEILGIQLASVVERMRLHEETQRLYVDLKSSYDTLARTQAELVKHERLAALGELAAVMAHEVRNPLGVIFNSLATFRRLFPPTPDAEMLLTMVGEEADRLNRIVGDLLDFARPYEVAKKPVPIEPVISGAIDAAQQTLANSQVTVRIYFEPGLPPIAVDVHLIRQALVNLVVNGIQAMSLKGGTLTVSATLEQRGPAGWLALDVSDEGTGLSPQVTEKMFQPFFTTKATGTGLGLAVVKRITEAHQGEIYARSNSPAAGSTFSLRLPAL